MCNLYNSLLLKYYDFLDAWSPWQLKTRIEQLEADRIWHKEHIKKAYEALTRKQYKFAADVLLNVHPDYLLMSLNLMGGDSEIGYLMSDSPFFPPSTKSTMTHNVNYPAKKRKSKRKKK